MHNGRVRAGPAGLGSRHGGRGWGAGTPGFCGRGAALSLALVFVLGAFTARLPATLSFIGLGARVDDATLEPAQDVFDMLRAIHVDDPTAAKLQRGAIEGMIEALGDDYAEYIPPDDKPEFDKQMTGQFVGIGCQVETRDGWLTVVTPLEDSPAIRAGVLSGDRIVKVDGETTFGLTVDQCIKRLTGEPGTPVTITVQRDGGEHEIPLTRARVTSRSIRGTRRLPDGTGHWDYTLDDARKVAYIRMSQFTPTSPGELLEALRGAQESMGGIGGLVLDLRNNPGGFMDAAISIVDLFVKDGVIMSIRGRDGSGETFKATRRGTLPEFPVAVLVNRASASASEIVSGALQDHDRAVVIGERTFGKGLVQTVHSIPHLPKAEVKFTTQRYYLPSGRLIQRTDASTDWGVDPTPGFYTPLSDKDQIAWLLWRRDHDIIPAGAKDQPIERWADPAWVEETAKDKQLAAAVRAMDQRLAGGAWAPISDVKEEHGKLATNELHALERARVRINREFLRLDKRIETLEQAAQTGKAPPKPKDFWPDTLDLTDGRIEVRDKDGKEIARLKITGRDVERWLAAAEVEQESVPGVGTAAPAEPEMPNPNVTPQK